jgi:Arc/MetJ-type ribon-helix-helix transcriptional regulator
MICLKQLFSAALAMNQSFPVDIQERINAQMATGSFSTEEDVLREALESLERRQNGLRQLQEMVAAAEVDVASSRVGTFDRQSIKRDVRRRLADKGIVE